MLYSLQENHSMAKIQMLFLRQCLSFSVLLIASHSCAQITAYYSRSGKCNQFSVCNTYKDSLVFIGRSPWYNYDTCEQFYVEYDSNRYVMNISFADKPTAELIEDANKYFRLRPDDTLNLQGQFPDEKPVLIYLYAVIAKYDRRFKESKHIPWKSRYDWFMIPCNRESNMPASAPTIK